jgi:uncharacterized protein YmfQ (DUF2313 family)
MAKQVAFPRDRHVRRDGPAYVEAFAKLLPHGLAWPRKPGSVLMRTVKGLALYYGFVDARAADLLERESDPRKTTEVSYPDGTEFFPPGTQDGLLPDWEKSWGLPDPCFPKATTIDERRRMLVMVMTMLGGQSRAWFKWVADWIGTELHLEQWTEHTTLPDGSPGPDIVHNGSIHEWSPFTAGISHVGDTRMMYDKTGYYRWEIGAPEMRFYWTISPSTATVVWFRASSGQAGVDPHCQVRTPEDLACLFRRWKPAHTELVYDLSSLAAGGPMQGTP